MANKDKTKVVDVNLIKKYKKFVPVHYFDFEEHDDHCLAIDVELAELSCNKNKIIARVYNDKSSGQIIFKIYGQSNDLSISKVVPILTQLDLFVLQEDAFRLNAGNLKPAIHRYVLSLPKAKISSKGITFLAEIMELILNQKKENDSLYRLCYLEDISFQLVDIIRVYIAYLKQIKFEIDEKKIRSILIQYHSLSAKLINLFEVKFSPRIINKERSAIVTEAERLINLDLNNISNNTSERCFLIILQLINATTRTNFFIPSENDEQKSYISIKLRSDLIHTQRPVPYAEIFTFAEDFESIHIRGGKVSRGGIRWSDRGDDYRTEVYGLAKTQIAKNSIIVPTGAKGGFFVKKKQTSKEDVVTCYKNFLRSILDITDNISAGKITRKKEVITYDEDDCYIVAAADKGTATFSDIANQISKDYGFWLGDAFASGGSNGYDHKKMSITANGAWESVLRHMADLEMDISEDKPIRIIGIGDMSGDVFGNGVLYSKNILLIAAFNHKHIFIDPNPNIKVAYEERLRLFTNVIGWDGYDVKKISKGGGLFNRSDNKIKLSQEIIDCLKIEDESHKKIISADDLVKYILKAKVDLLWNGGIGTFIKSETETNESVNDAANNDIRINGKDVGAKIIGEGGNLGLTQKGRNEYYLAGGKLNTDAIDNSAGVCCSDNEVNIKIALNEAVKDKFITLAQRNLLLEQMKDEVARSVIENNYLQNRIISISEQNDMPQSLLRYGNLITYLHKIGLLNRDIEGLPPVHEITRRYSLGLKLTRPEISILLNYAKIHLKKEIIKSGVVKMPEYEDYLFNYFPSQMRTKFSSYIKNHPIKDDIIANCLANEMINNIGITFAVDTINIASSSYDKIVKAYITVLQVFPIRKIWDFVRNDQSVPVNIKYDIMYNLANFIQRMISRMIGLGDIFINKRISSFIKYAVSIYNDKNITSKLIEKEQLQSKITHYINHGVTQEIAEAIVMTHTVRPIFTIITVSSRTDKENESIGCHDVIDDILDLRKIRNMIYSNKIESYWDWIVLMKMVNSASSIQSDITEIMVNMKINLDDLAQKLNEICKHEIDEYNAIYQKIEGDTIGIIATMNLIIDQLNKIKTQLKLSSDA